MSKNHDVMREEKEFAQDNGMFVWECEEWDDESKEDLVHALNEWELNGKE